MYVVKKQRLVGVANETLLLDVYKRQEPVWTPLCFTNGQRSAIPRGSSYR